MLQGQVVHWGSVPLGLQDPGAQLGLVSLEHLAPPFVPSDLPRDKEDIRCHNLVNKFPCCCILRVLNLRPPGNMEVQVGGRSIVEHRAAGQGRECGPEVKSQ